MRLLTWNIRHGGGVRVPLIVDHLRNQGPDIAVLTEFRRNECGCQIEAALEACGLCYRSVPEAPASRNTLLVASRYPFEPETFYTELGEHSHRCLRARFGSFSLFAFYFPLKREKIPLFEFACGLSASFTNTPAVLIGDFNTGRHQLDEAGATFIAAEYLERLESNGWVDAWRRCHPEAREYSWYSSAGNGFRIDHAFASAPFDRWIDRVRYSQEERMSGASDHAALIVDLTAGVCAR